VGEVDDARAAVDQHDALREQRVRRTGAETEDRELDRLRHAAENLASNHRRGDQHRSRDACTGTFVA
jgi:hypothetical protein